MVRTERGQLILVAAVLVALVVVSTVVLLNTIHTPSDIHTDRIADEASEAKTVSAAIHSDLEGLFEHNTSTAHDIDHPLPFVRAEDEGSFRSAVEEYDSLQARMTAKKSSGIVTVTYDSADSIDGKAVYQLDNSSFVSAPPVSDSDWTVFQSTTDLTRIQMNVTSRSSENTTLLLRDASLTEWHLNLSTDNVFTTDQGELCETGAIPDFEDAWVHVDITGERGRVEVISADGTTVCDTFEVGSNLVDTTWEVEFENGDETEGNYTITATGTVNTLNVNDDTLSLLGDFPQSDSGIINPAFDVNYTSDTITYHAEYNLYNRTAP